MQKNIIYFVETRMEERRHLLCLWVEHLFEKGMKVQIATDSSMAAQHLDQLLWSFSQESFIPHHVVTKKDSCDDLTPVVITVGEILLDGFRVLVCDGPTNLDFVKNYPLTVHFVLLNDTERRQESRLMWQTARDLGMQLHHVAYSSKAKLPAICQ